MSALTDLFTTMANSIRGKTGTQTTYTPSEMATDGIDDVYAAGYAAGGGGGGGAVPITPSNSSPASMSANVAYEPTANGYAIESYSSVTPSDSTPAALTNGAIYKAGGAGYAIASNPTSVTPSSSGEYFTSGIKKMASSGYAYASQPTIQSTMTLIGTLSNVKSTAVTATLSSGLSNYDLIFIVVGQNSSDPSWSTDHFINLSATKCICYAAKPTYLSQFTSSSNSVAMYAVGGSNGSMSSITINFWTTSNSSVTMKTNSSSARYFYIYGWKSAIS